MPLRFVQACAVVRRMREQRTTHTTFFLKNLRRSFLNKDPTSGLTIMGGVTISSAAGVDVRGPHLDRFDEVLTGPALEFVARLHREFEPKRQALLQARHE